MDVSQDFIELVTECRDRCLWFPAPDSQPVGRKAQLSALDCVEWYGSREDFIRARRLKQRLLRHSNEVSIVSEQ